MTITVNTYTIETKSIRDAVCRLVDHARSGPRSCASVQCTVWRRGAGLRLLAPRLTPAFVRSCRSARRRAAPRRRTLCLRGSKVCAALRDTEITPAIVYKAAKDGQD